MKNIENYKSDFATVWAAMERTEKQMAETDKQIAETNKQMAETNKQMAETDKQIAKTSKQMAETDTYLKERFDKTDKQIAETTASIKEFLESIRETRKEVKGISKSYGMHAESYFFESLKKSKQFGGITYDFVDDGYKGSERMPNGELITGEFDIVMHNGDSIAIIEVKSRVKQDDVIYLVNRKIGDFKKIFPQHANNKFYLGVAGFSFDINAEKQAMSRGVGILKLSGENLEIQDKHLIVY